MKKVTLPIYNKEIYESLAEIMWSLEENKKDKDKFIAKTMNDLGKEAFLHSFTPSGEIGSGETVRNPYNKTNSEIFFDAFSDVFGESGEITELVAQNTNSEKLVKNRVNRIKAAIIELINVYVESVDEKLKNPETLADKKRAETEGLFIATVLFHKITEALMIDYYDVVENSLLLKDENKKRFIQKIRELL